MRCHIYYLPNTRFAFALIRAALDALNLPRLTICVARAFAFAACERSGIGYFLTPGKPNVLDFSLLRRAALNLAILPPPYPTRDSRRLRLYFWLLLFTYHRREGSECICVMRRPIVQRLARIRPQIFVILILITAQTAKPNNLLRYWQCEVAAIIVEITLREDRPNCCDTI